MIIYPTTDASVAKGVPGVACVAAKRTKLVPFTIVPTLKIPKAVDAPTPCLHVTIREFEVTDVDATVAVPDTKVTEPKLFAPAVVVVPTLALNILFPDVTKFRLPVTFTDAAVNANPPDPALIVVDDAPTAFPRAKM